MITFSHQVKAKADRPPNGSRGTDVACAVLMPHAPILVPGVGGSAGNLASASRQAMQEVARCLVALQPESLVVISPHAPRKPRAFGIWAEERLRGSFAQFGAPEIGINLTNDRPLAEVIRLKAKGLRLETWPISNRSLDHGALVPLWFLTDAGYSAPAVLVSLNYPEDGGLEHLGKAIAAAANVLHRRIAIVASGDMSHRLTEGAPCGFHSRAHVFDETFMELVRAGDFTGIRRMDQELRGLAAEDAVDSTQVAAAAVDWDASGHRVLSYEGPFGVGYGVAILYAAGAPPEEANPESNLAAPRERSILPDVARQSVAAALGCGPNQQPAATGSYLTTPSGVFVTLRMRNGKLRGCVGTITPVCANLVAETWRNARLAALNDPRFSPVTARELPELVFHVSVIHSLHVVTSPSELSPRRYGVVVTTDDGRRGVLLPGITEIGTSEQQLALARRKGCIEQHEPVHIQRFEVDSFEEPSPDRDT